MQCCRISFLSLVLLGLALLLSAHAQTVDPLLWVPDNLYIETDEFLATLWWGEPPADDRPNPANVVGYYLYWKKQSDSWTAAKKITVTWRVAQMQPLIAGTIYEARVVSVSNMGVNVSDFSAVVQFQSNSTRVNALRQICTGFFDDFNQPAQGFDPLKWHTSFAGCNDPERTFSFINDQLHAHTMTSSMNCDRSQTASRAKAIFDFTGRTGNIFVDLDSAFDRDVWYLEISPVLIDIPGHSVSHDQGKPAGPANSLRVRLDNNNPRIVRVDMSGAQITLNTTTDFSSLDWGRNYNYKYTNVRTPLHVLINTSGIELRVRDIPITWTAFEPPLNWTRAHVLFNQFSYNTPKGAHNLVYTTMHWDNFGFDGTAPTVTTFDYPGDLKGFRSNDSNSEIRFNVTVPDNISAATAVRLMFLQNGGGDWEINYFRNDNVILNGQSITIPYPNDSEFAAFGLHDTVTIGGLLSTLNPFTSIITLTPQQLVMGVNTLVFKVGCGVIGNVHIEVDVPKTSSYSYTYPAPNYSLYAGGFPLNTWAHPYSVGGELTFTQVGTKTLTYLDNYYQGGQNPIVFEVYPMPADSAMPVVFDCTGDRPALHHGSNRGLGWAQLYINKTSIATMALNGAPAVTDAKFTFDSRALPNNQNIEVWVACYGADGGMSANGYEWTEVNSTWNRYKPVVISISSGGGQSVTLTGTPQDSSPTLLPTPASPTFPPSLGTVTIPASTTGGTTTAPVGTSTATATTAPTSSASSTTPSSSTTHVPPTKTGASTTPAASSSSALFLVPTAFFTFLANAFLIM